MAETDESIQILLDALSHSPDNVKLRCHICEQLMSRARYDETESLLREGIELTPASEQIKLQLASCFYHQAKNNASMVIVEELLQRGNPDAEVHLLHARLLLREDQTDNAARAYRKAIDINPDLADEDLAEAVGANDEDDDEWASEVDDQGRVRLLREEQSAFANFEMEKPDTGFRDVGGMEEVKEQIRLKIIEPLNHPEIYKAYGKAIGGGILMYGPPGCGKTHLARATAGEVNAGFINVGISDILDMYIGQSEQNLHSLFEYARKNTPCVLFFDEVDALGASRTDMRQNSGKMLINQFLSEMDGVKDSNDGVLILGATNAPWHLDSAFRRPGRFDRILFVPPPDAPARDGILRTMLRDKPVHDVDFDSLAKKASNLSGADLKAVVDIAIESKLEDAIKTGTPTPLVTKDLLGAIKKVRPSTREWFSTAKNYAMYSNEAGLYDDILDFLKLR